MQPFQLVRAANFLDQLQTDRWEFSDLNNKLAILCVLARVKPASALGLREAPLPQQTTTGLDQFADRYGLQHKSTSQPARCFRSQCPVPRYFVEQVDRMSGARHAPNVLWVFHSRKTETQIDRAVAGEVDVGYVLGYPECCITAHAEQQNASLARFYEGFMRQYRPRSEAEAIRLLRKDVQVNDPGYFEYTTRNVEPTLKKFPFVFHVACDDCLKGRSNATRNLNQTDRAIAENGGAYFYRRLLDARPT